VTPPLARALGSLCAFCDTKKKFSKVSAVVFSVSEIRPRHGLCRICAAEHWHWHTFWLFSKLDQNLYQCQCYTSTHSDFSKLDQNLYQCQCSADARVSTCCSPVVSEGYEKRVKKRQTRYNWGSNTELNHYHRTKLLPKRQTRDNCVKYRVAKNKKCRKRQTRVNWVSNTEWHVLLSVKYRVARSIIKNKKCRTSKVYQMSAKETGVAITGMSLNKRDLLSLNKRDLLSLNKRDLLSINKRDLCCVNPKQKRPVLRRSVSQECTPACF